MSKPAEEVLHYFMESIDTMELKEGESLKLKNSLKVAYDDLQKDKDYTISHRYLFENFKIKFHKTNVDSRCNEILEIKQYIIYKGYKPNEFVYVYNGVLDFIECNKFKRMIRTIMSLTSCMCLEVSSFGINKTIYYADVMKSLKIERKLDDEFNKEDNEGYDEEEYLYIYDEETFYKIISNKIHSMLINNN
jgi:hypothetical protein